MSQLRKIASSMLAAIVFTAGCAAGPLAQQGTQAAPEAKGSPSDAVVKVNGTPITRLELERSMKIMQMQNRGAKLTPDALAKARENVLEQLTNSELLYQASKGVEIKDLDEKVGRQLKENRAKYASEEEFEAVMKQLDMSQKELEEFTRRDIAINNLIEKQFADKAAVSDEDALKFYNVNKGRYFEKGETVRASHILVGVAGGASPEQKKQAREKALDLLKRVKSGEDFGKIAKEASTCASRERGGDLGEFGRGAMATPFENAVYALKPGQVSEVVETQFGYHIIKLVEKIAPKTEKFEDVKAKIVDYLKREKVRAQVPGYLKELRSKAKIEKV